MVGWQQISIPIAIIEVRQYRYFKSETAIVLVGSLTIRGHQKKGERRSIKVQFSLIWPHIYPSHAKIHNIVCLPYAIKIEDHALERQNYQQIMNHLIKRMHAVHMQIEEISVSLIIVRELTCSWTRRVNPIIVILR